MSEIKSKTVNAAGWVMASRVISQIISFGFGIALARLLTPDDFGLIAMVMVFTGVAGLLSDIGLGAALIQKKDVYDIHFSSVFWINLTVACMLAVILFFVSPLLSDFYSRPEVENICKAMALGFPLGALSSVPRTRLVKELLFKYITISEVVALIVSGVIAIILAILGFGYWSLVVNILLQQFIQTIIIWWASKWRPGTRVSQYAIKELMGFSLSVFATQFLQYIGRNIDKLVLGKFLGGKSLGVYDKAQSLMLFPLQNISHVIGSVMFPSLSIIQSDNERVKYIYLRAIRAIALLTFPMMAGIFVVADVFVIGVLGHQWIEVIPVLRIFCFAGMISSIVTVTGSLYRSQGAAALQLRINLITQPIRIAGIILGLHWGILGVTSGYCIALFVNSMITLSVAGKLIDLKLFTLIKYLAPIVTPTALMTISLYVFQSFVVLKSELLALLLQVIVGVILYWIFLILMKVEAYTDVKTVLIDEFLAWERMRLQR